MADVAKRVDRDAFLTLATALATVAVIPPCSRYSHTHAARSSHHRSDVAVYGDVLRALRAEKSRFHHSTSSDARALCGARAHLDDLALRVVRRNNKSQHFEQATGVPQVVGVREVRGY